MKKKKKMVKSLASIPSENPGTKRTNGCPSICLKARGTSTSARCKRKERFQNWSSYRKCVFKFLNVPKYRRNSYYKKRSPFSCLGVINWHTDTPLFFRPVLRIYKYTYYMYTCTYKFVKLRIILFIISIRKSPFNYLRYIYTTRSC